MVKKGTLGFVSFDMKRFSDAIWPVSFCTSFLLYRGCIWVIDLILSRFALMPVVDTK
jgi:hypothetical protein